MQGATEQELKALEYIAVRVERGTDVAVILDAIGGTYYGDKGDILDAFAEKRLYVVRAKQSAKSIKMKHDRVFCR